jgi:hypothetical protein
VFLVDEALAVGDLRFASKALRRIRELLESGTTLLLVSHDLQLVNSLCSRALWLTAGTVRMDGPPSIVTRAYQQYVVRGTVETPTPAEAVLDLPPATQAAPGDIIALGNGWYPLEAAGGDPFRWAGSEAEVVVPSAMGPRADLLLDIEPGPSTDGPGLHIQVLNAAGAAIQELGIASRGEARIPLSTVGREPQWLRLRALNSGRAVPNDGRQLVFRVFGWRWSGGQPLPIRDARASPVETDGLDLDQELINMVAALRRCPATPDAPVSIVRIVTKDGGGSESVRFATYDTLAIEITLRARAQVRGLVVGVQLRDVFDRMLWGTRLDWQAQQLPTVGAEEEVTITFSTARLLLGSGVYQLTVGCHRYPHDSHVFQWVDGAWRFEVLRPVPASFVGVFDLDLRYLGIDKVSPVMRMPSSVTDAPVHATPRLPAGPPQ